MDNEFEVGDFVTVIKINNKYTVHMGHTVGKTYKIKKIEYGSYDSYKYALDVPYATGRDRCWWYRKEDIKLASFSAKSIISKVFYKNKKGEGVL